MTYTHVTVASSPACAAAKMAVVNFDAIEPAFVVPQFLALLLADGVNVQFA